MSALFSPESHVQHMLRFEAALALAEARAGVIPTDAAQAIAVCCRVELFDVAAIYREAGTAGTPAIPLVRLLTERVNSEARKYVHWGATSQDAIDSALMLQVRAGLDLLIHDLDDACRRCADFAECYRYTLMVGRTLLQQALPMTFGLKAARWLASMLRQVRTLRRHREQTLAVQLGGAVGTLASLGTKGFQVVELLATELGLPVPDLPWHSERGRVAEIASSLGILAGAVGKIADDIAHLAQTEVGEASEGAAPGKGGSSTLPQKHNPVDAMGALASARLAFADVSVILSAMIQEHERAVGGWQAEWTAIPNLFCHVASAVEHVRNALSGLSIDSTQMRAKLDLHGGLVMAEALTMALAPRLGRPQAQHIVKDVCAQVAQTGGNLAQAAFQNVQICAILSPEEIRHALDPAAYLGHTDVFIERVLASYREVTSH